jgi:penicillin amidase
MVTLHRVLRTLNILAAGLFIAAVWAGYRYLWRPLPETKGWLRAPVGGVVSIARDELGRPHIEARNELDALFAQGFATAQDRMWQMDMARRMAGGELSEVAGPAAVALDLRARRVRMRRIAETQAREINDAERAGLAAYARGVNYYLETHAGALPVEFHLMHYVPRPWGVADSLLILLAMNRTLTESWESDLEKWRMEQEGFPERVDRLFPIRDGGEITPGSNAWAISGKRSTSGQAILANDPHLEFSMPATWYAVQLQAPGLNAAGVTLPGVPGILIGHNERIAWGITGLQFDTQDLYFEEIDLRSGHFLFRGQQLQAIKETEFIAVRGGAPQGVETLVTVHGPILTADNGRHLAMKWAAAAPGATFPVLELDRARNWEEFRRALSRFTGPGLNVLYADAEGNIGEQVAGRLPLRRSFTGDVPVEGAGGKLEWEGFIPFEQLPTWFNPPSGILISANQNPFPEKTPWRVNGRFAPHYRQRQILDRLNVRPKWDAEGMSSIQTDVYSALLMLIRQEVLRVAARGPGAKGLEQQAVEILRGWNGQVTAQRAAPLVAVLTYQQLRRRIAEKAAPVSGAKYAAEMAPAVVEMMLRERPREWFADWDRTVREAFADAMEEGRRMQGRRIDRWSYGRYNEVTLAHPAARSLGWLGQFLNIGPVGMGGYATTVQETTRTFGPSMRFVAMAGAWDKTLLTLTTGDSGQLASRHYKDEWTAYRYGRGLKFEFSKQKGWPVLTLQPK